MLPVRATFALVASALAMGGCVSTPEAQRSGLGEAVPVDEVADPDAWGAVSGDPARDRAATSGLVVVRTTRSIAATTTGRVSAVEVRQGDVVEAGQVLVTIRSTSAAVDELEAAVLALGEALAGRPSADELNALLDARNAAAARVAAEAPFGGNEPVDVVAPVAGVVSGVSPSLGERVEAGQDVAAMGDTSEVEVQAGLPTVLLDALDAGSGRALVIERGEAGAVTPARLAGADDRIVRTEDDGATTVVRFVFDDAPPLVDGDRVDLEVEIDAGTETASVPVAALRQVADEVFVLADVDGELVRVDVEVRLVGDEVAEVEGDLSIGQAVLLR